MNPSHIRQYHDNAIASTLEESLSLFDAKCSTKIWKMMNQEFLNTRSAILDSENRQSNLRSPSQPSSGSIDSSSLLGSLPLSTRKLVTPSITTGASYPFHFTQPTRRTTTSPSSSSTNPF